MVLRHFLLGCFVALLVGIGFDMGRAHANEKFAVKVVSSYCGMFDVESLQRRGSGVLVSRKGQNYVLTSDHVLYHGNRDQGYCHKILAGENEYEAHLTAVSFAHGLALYQVDRVPESKAALDYESLYEGMKTCESRRTSEITSYGYSWRSMSLTVGSGKILNAASDRHLLAAVETLYESDLYSELGMSGGPVFAGDRDEFAGILSHQVLVRALGEESRVQSLSPESAGINGLVIPLCPIAIWLTETFGGAPSLALDPHSQMSGKEAAVIGQVRFQVAGCQNPEEEFEPVGGRITSKYELKPSHKGRLKTGQLLQGSGDGVGIGGLFSGRLRDCSIHLSWDNGATDSGWPFSFQQEWFQAVRRAVHQRAQVVVDSILLNGNIIPLDGSLGRFFALMRRGGLPLTRVSSLNHPEQQSLAELRRVNDSIADALDDLREPWGRMASQDPVAGVLWTEIYEVVSTIAGGHHQVICVDRLNQLIQSPAWSRLYLGTGFDSDRVIGLKALLNQLKSTLNHLTITRGCR